MTNTGTQKTLGQWAVQALREPYQPHSDLEPQLVYSVWHRGEESVPVGKLETSRRRNLWFQVLAYTANNCAGIKERLCQFWAWSTWGRLCSFPWSESFLLDIAVLKSIFTEDFIGSLHFHSRLPPFTTFPKLLCVTGWISSLWNY